MNNTIKTLAGVGAVSVGIIIIAMFCAVSLSLIGQQNAQRPYSKLVDPTMPPSAPITIDKEYRGNTMEDIRASFIDGCTTEGVTKAQCSCMYDALTEKYGLETVIEDSIAAIKTNTLPDGWLDTVVKCY